MAILKGCCCWQNVRSGSFAAGFYTSILYIFILTGAAFHVTTVFITYHMLWINLVMILFYISCIAASVVLLIGLTVDSKGLLIPWIVAISSTTLLDFILSLYILIDTLDTFMATLFSFDIIIWLLNIYSILCVFSQFQEYRAEQSRNQDEPRRILGVELQENCCIPCALIRDTVSKSVPVGTSHISADTLVISANICIESSCDNELREKGHSEKLINQRKADFVEMESQAS